MLGMLHAGLRRSGLTSTSRQRKPAGTTHSDVLKKFCRFMRLNFVAIAALIVTVGIVAAGATALPAATKSLGGVYAVNSMVKDSIDTQVLSNPDVDGIVLRFGWTAIEPRDGVFDWSQLDAQIAQAAAYGKKVSIGIFAGYGTPSWLYVAGAQRFKFLWDQQWGPPPCSVQTIPVPWDPIFVTRWVAFIRAFGQRYDLNPTVAHVKLTGINYETEEHSLPHSVKASINAGRCISYDDVTDWRSIGYTRTRVIDSWRQIADAYHDFFPHKPFAAQLVPGGFPPIDDDGKIIAGQAVDYQVSTDILSDGMTDFGVQFVGQNNGLSATWVWPQLVSDAGRIDTGYQTAHIMGDTLRAAVDLAINSRAKFLEIYTTDILDPDLQGALAYAHEHLN
jgi:Beta-galactosidase